MDSRILVLPSHPPEGIVSEHLLPQRSVSG